MKLLISTVDEKEAREAIQGGAEIIDVKNPKEGALGASFPWVIRRIREIAPETVEVSCTLGDMPNLPGATSLAALGAATTGVNYIKAGLNGIETEEDAVFLMKNVARAAGECSPSIKIVATGFADAQRVNSVNPMLVPEIAYKAEIDVAMIDTAVKDGNNLFNYLTTEQLRRFVEDAQDRGLRVAFAGSLTKKDLPTIHALGADIVGLRGAACTGGDRTNGRINQLKVRELVEIKKRLETQVEIRV
jgi:uncharacterized protein (UPF0264 family)